MAPGFDPGQPIAKGAVDMAAHDLICKKLGINLQTWLGSKLTDRIELSYLVSAPDPEATGKVVEQGLSEGFRAFKLKVGHDPSVDVENVRVAMEIAKGCIVWPDANQGYDLDQALRAAQGFEKLAHGKGRQSHVFRPFPVEPPRAPPGCRAGHRSGPPAIPRRGPHARV